MVLLPYSLTAGKCSPACPSATGLPLHCLSCTWKGRILPEEEAANIITLHWQADNGPIR